MKFFNLVLLCAVLLFGGAIGTAQTPQTWLEQVPTLSRERLAIRVQQYFEYESKREYEKLYDLLSEGTLKSFGTREAYAKFRRDSSFRVLNFKPVASGYDSKKGVYVISGEGEIHDRGEARRDIVSVEATLRNGDWTFSELYMVLSEFPGVETLTTTNPTLNNAPDFRKPRKP